MSDWLIDVMTLASIRLKELLNDTIYKNKKQRRKLNKARRVITGKRRKRIFK